MKTETVRLEDEKLSQAKTDNFAIWGWEYSQLWMSDKESFEEEFPCCGDEPTGPKMKWEDIRKTGFAYQKHAPIWNFAKDVAEELMNAFDRPDSEVAELSHKWNQFFITRRDGAKVLVLSEAQIKVAFEKFGIRGVYALAVLAVAQMEIGVTGPQSKKMSKELKAKMVEAANALSFDYAILCLTKPVDRLCWSY